MTSPAEVMLFDCEETLSVAETLHRGPCQELHVAREEHEVQLSHELGPRLLNLVLSDIPRSPNGACSPRYFERPSLSGQSIMTQPAGSVSAYSPL